MQLIDFSWFIVACDRSGIQAPADVVEKLDAYVRLVLEWNSKINLVSRKSEDEIWKTHIYHSALLFTVVRFPESSRIVDIGTGGGFPGMVLKILQPDLDILLVDSIAKKGKAVSEMIGALGLTGIAMQTGRAEELSRRPEYAHAFDYAVARAVAPLKDLVKWSLPFLAEKEKNSHHVPGAPPHGSLVAYKGGEVAGEIAEVLKWKNRTACVVRDLIAPAGETGLEEKKLVVVTVRK